MDASNPMSEPRKFRNSGAQVDAGADRLHAEGRIAQQLLGPAWSCVHVFYAVMVDELVLTGVHAGTARTAYRSTAAPGRTSTSSPRGYATASSA